ncbi:tetratricopeptide repeat protein [Pedosphaera parvula]|uniref:Tetratricopeptide TPR_2 repeat protein n=1 Tax=Pedosphaera parvula (strain Ellin514) TaxID=320771 RepID=B9XFI5_PEDPL|nr:tetratricopeptide repeat protein [Pedosphaera parvula]EEF61349.1 Tetratricopeptide TPR_2 repeat protein [Pedosphaera parvula Ellin514]
MMGKRLLLIGWEAADWKILHSLIDAGEMPVLRRIVEGGASGQLLSTQPLTPVAQWTSIATGKRPWQHRICHPIESITVANETVPVTAARRRSLALWEMLAQAGKRSLIVGWPATHGGRAENTIIVSDRYAQPTAGPGIKPWPPAAPGTYWPEEIGVRLDGWRMSPADVQADIISLCVPEWKKIDQKRDRRLGQLRVFLAADFSHQAAMMTLLSGGNWDIAAVHFPALGAISRMFLANHLSSPESIPEAESALYQNVIRGTCRLLDQMLGNLVRAAGSDTATMVVSAHGVARCPAPPANMRATDDEWKSPRGIFAACGRGLTGNAQIFGASVLDVAPTVLTWFGLPIGDDMEGRVLVESFVKPPEIARIASWEPTQSVSSPHAAEVPGAPGNSAAAATLRGESDWNLAQSYLEASRYEDALPIFEGLFRSFPERPELGHALFQCQLTLRKLSEATETLEVVLEGLPAGIWSLLPRAELCLAKGQIQEARALVNEARQLHPTHPDALRRLGLLLLRLREWNALEDLARQALKLDDNDALAWAGLAEAQLRKQLAAEATESALKAIQLNYYLSEAHFVLARALVAKGKWAQARDAMQVLLQLQPNNRAAATYGRRLG